MNFVIDDFLTKFQQYEKDFITNSVLITRLIARRKNSFRHMRGFCDLYKIRTCLGRLMRLDFKRHINSLRTALPDMALPDGCKQYLPSRNYYEYILLKLISVYELYQYIHDMCKQIAKFFFGLIYANYFFDFNILIIAIISKLKHLSMKLLNLHAELYNKLQIFSNELPQVNTKLKQQSSQPLYSNNYKFPEKLDYYDNNNTKTSSSSQEKSKLSSKSTTIELNNNPTKLNDCPDNGNDQLRLAQAKIILNRKKSKIDVGTVVKRKKNNLNVNVDSQQFLQSIELIENFIRTESNKRKQSRNTSITNSIEEYEWQAAIKLFYKKILNPNNENKAIRFFQNFINAKLY